MKWLVWRVYLESMRVKREGVPRGGLSRDAVSRVQRQTALRVVQWYSRIGAKGVLAGHGA